jgi:hypothetical protein
MVTPGAGPGHKWNECAYLPLGLRGEIMRTITTTLILCIFALPLQAADWRESCGNFGKVAKMIMEKRQSGASMAKMMEAITDIDNSVVEMMIMSAYDRPRYSTEQMQQRTIEEFRDDVYLECVKVLRP